MLKNLLTTTAYHAICTELNCTDFLQRRIIFMSKDSKQDEKIKYINVTEARARFATIVGDKTSFYVITKNSKPKRVIVNYDDFLILEQGRATPNQPLQGTPAVVSEPPLKKKSKMTPEHPVVKGLLKERMEQGGMEGDYFGGETEDHDANEALVKNPAEISDEDFDAADLNEQASGQEIKSQELEIESEDLDRPPPDTQEKQNLASHEAHSSDQADKKDEEEEAFLKNLEEKHSPEERDYFLRYRKLYESLDPSRNQSRHGLKRLSQKSLPLRQKSPHHEALSLEDIEKQVQESFQVEAGLKEMSPSTQKKDLFVENFGNAADAPLSEGQEGLPSLQDLLEDLEQEKLSEEEEDSLDEQEINELINRITSD